MTKQPHTESNNTKTNMDYQHTKPRDATTLHITIKAENNGTYTATATKTGPTNTYDWNPTNNTQTNYITEQQHKKNTII